MRSVLFITHPEVRIDPEVPVPLWSLSALGAQRMRRFAEQLHARNVQHVWSSEERKAIEAAQILAESLGLTPRTYQPLGENDRRSTGYLDKARFEAMADRFFAQPELSAEGWER